MADVLLKYSKGATGKNYLVNKWRWAQSEAIEAFLVEVLRRRKRRVRERESVIVLRMMAAGERIVVGSDSELTSRLVEIRQQQTIRTNRSFPRCDCHCCRWKGSWTFSSTTAARRQRLCYPGSPWRPGVST